MLSSNSPINPQTSRDRLTVVLESGLAGPPQAWLPVAQRLDSDFRVVIHRRSKTTSDLKSLAEELHVILRHPPYLLVAHSFGALVARQFAAAYPAETAGIVSIDGLPVTTQIRTAKALVVVRFAEMLATFSLIRPMLPFAAKRIEEVAWAMTELDKIPNKAQVLAEWTTPSFYRSVARLLTALPRNLRTAHELPELQVPMLSLYSDYYDPQGRYIENSGHWIQVDQPEQVAAAVRELAAMT